jgi:hypothetical protein
MKSDFIALIMVCLLSLGTCIPPLPTLGIGLIRLDGGRNRDLFTLYLLNHLMKLLNPTKPPKPCEIFDLIGGSGSGR